MITNMRKERLERGWTLRDVSELIGKSPSSISKWERKQGGMMCANVFSLCKLYSCSPEYLFDLVEDRTGTAIPR